MLATDVVHLHLYKDDRGWHDTNTKVAFEEVTKSLARPFPSKVVTVKQVKQKFCDLHRRKGLTQNAEKDLVLNNRHILRAPHNEPSRLDPENQLRWHSPVDHMDTSSGEPPHKIPARSPRGSVEPGQYSQDLPSSLCPGGGPASPDVLHALRSENFE